MWILDVLKIMSATRRRDNVKNTVRRQAVTGALRVISRQGRAIRYQDSTAETGIPAQATKTAIPRRDSVIPRHSTAETGIPAQAMKSATPRQASAIPGRSIAATAIPVQAKKSAIRTRENALNAWVRMIAKLTETFA